jgi:hypothetical protein
MQPPWGHLCATPVPRQSTRADQGPAPKRLARRGYRDGVSSPQATAKTFARHSSTSFWLRMHVGEPATVKGTCIPLFEAARRRSPRNLMSVDTIPTGGDDYEAVGRTLRGAEACGGSRSRHEDRMGIREGIRR